jgi:hypothetical protein
MSEVPATTDAGDVPAGKYAEARAELQRLAAKAKWAPLLGFWLGLAVGC